MPVLTFVTSPDEAQLLVGWGARLAAAQDRKLIVLCWQFSPGGEFPLLADEEQLRAVGQTVDAAQDVCDSLALQPASESDPGSRGFEIRPVLSADFVASALDAVRNDGVQLLIAAATDPAEASGSPYTSDPVLRQSPCNTLLLYTDHTRSQRSDNLLVKATDSAHDRVAVSLAARMAQVEQGRLSIATIEDDTGDEAMVVGHRMLEHLIRDAVVQSKVDVTPRVFLTDETFSEVIVAAEQNDLVLIGANESSVAQKLFVATKWPTIGIVKRAPPLRRGWGNRFPQWVPRLNPADYADLVMSLRRGSQFGTDYMVMTGLSAAIASFGLIQDSPAVVIGSMLLAPLMTPMIGCGLALAQANSRLARMCYRSIISGFVLTLIVSFLIGWLTPGEELTQQVAARGNPNVLDLMIALFSAMAAAYALARPNLLGAVAGVAIATALMPPLCSFGISLAYGQYLIGLGAAALFTTNLVAIIVAAAATFRLMGVTMARAAPRTRRWVYHVAGVLGMIGVLLAIPLTLELRHQIEFGRPQPIAYPLPRSVVEALVHHLRNDDGVDLILAGRTSMVDSDYDVSIWLSSRRPLDRSYEDIVAAVVRREMGDETLVVEVRSLVEAWDSAPPENQ